MKIGLNIGMGGESFDTQVAMTVAAEDAGLNSVWFAQHVGYDAMMLAADAARRTARIGVATGVTPIYPRHPIAVASQAHSARVVAGERFRLGIGVSHRPFTENIHGLRYTSPARYLREYVTVVRQLLDDRRSHFEGEFFSVDCDLEVEDRGAVPVFVAAMGALTLTVCGELADGVVTALAGPRMIAEHVVPRLAEASARAGRPMPAVVSTVPALVTSDRAGARERAGHFFEHTRRLDAYNEALLREGVDDPVDIAPIGSESEVRDILGRYREAGVTEFLISSFGSEADRRRTMEVLGSAPA